MATLTNGHSTTIACADDSSLTFEVISLTPFGLEVSEIDTTTMANTAYKSSIAGKLKKGNDMSMEVAYDPATLTEIKSLIGENQLWTITYPDAQTHPFWGFLKSWAPGPLTTDARPTASIVVTPTFENDSATEVPPTVA